LFIEGKVLTDIGLKEDSKVIIPLDLEVLFHLSGKKMGKVLFDINIVAFRIEG
jgi:hypothetical protein